MNAHYVSLLCGYGVAALLWFGLNYFLSLWRSERRVLFSSPAKEFLYAVLAILAILGIGQLYSHKLLIPNAGNVLIDAVNQIIIFSPTIILVALRKQSLETLWLPSTHIVIRLLIGFLLALCSILVYWATKQNSQELTSILLNTYHYKNISYGVQIFLEDITIALLFVRLSAWIGNRGSIIIVAILFAAGHIPALLSNGATATELSSLLLDAGLGILVLSAVSRSRDVWWFFMVHFAMDMTQFYG